MKKFRVTFSITQNVTHLVETGSAEEARAIAIQLIKRETPLHGLMHVSTIDTTEQEEKLKKHYDEYYDDMQRANRFPLSYDAWREREGY